MATRKAAMAGQEAATGMKSPDDTAVSRFLRFALLDAIAEAKRKRPDQIGLRPRRVLRSTTTTKGAWNDENEGKT
jgi:hypothetical protein